ncbi:MAG: putative Zn-dependent protease [Limisphaerales bacterium]|jgi:predicted Zn-dependent protease
MTRSLLFCLVLTLLIASCSRVPLTGRKQVKLLPESELVQMSLAAYNDFLQSNNVVQNTSQSEMVQRIGDGLAGSVEGILSNEGFSDRIDLLQWDFNLVQDDLINAWAMPGGKVVIYTGILPVTESETGLAVVMGHELAHAIALHGNERMSQAMLAQMGLATLDIAAMNQPEETRQLLMLAAGIGTEVGVLLPFSRKQESEADELGLIFMANAGYDPREAVRFWERMDQHTGSASVPQFLSTHPSHETRISDLQNKYLPTALTYYNQSQNSSNRSSGGSGKKGYSR